MLTCSQMMTLDNAFTRALAVENIASAGSLGQLRDAVADAANAGPVAPICHQRHRWPGQYRQGPIVQRLTRGLTKVPTGAAGSGGVGLRNRTDIAVRSWENRIVETA
jgi:hypothetical protein